LGIDSEVDESLGLGRVNPCPRKITSKLGAGASLLRRGFNCLMIYHDEIHFTTLYMADLGAFETKQYIYM
jgi:hypothetical protein